MRYMIAMLMAASLALGLPAAAGAQEWRDATEISALFEQQGVNGTFVMYDVQADRLTGHNQARAGIRYLPASTFKIPNTVIGLSTATVTSSDEPLPYGGKPQPFQAWERDMGLREAIKVSNVPVYQELARRIGLKTMRDEIASMGYGNGEIGSRVDRFWLDGPLRISAVEQVVFLSRLARRGLPQSREAQEMTREILLVDRGENWSLYAKTGTAMQERPCVGWWVGWGERNGSIYTFAINLDILDEEQDGPKRMKLARASLTLLGLLE